GRTGFNYLPVVCAYRLGDIPRMDVEIGFATDFVAQNKVAPFVFAVYQDITQLEILHENNGCAVIDNVLQPLFTVAQCLFGVPALLLGAERRDAIGQVAGQFRVLLNSALIEHIRLSGIKAEAAKPLSVSNQRERNARSIAARGGLSAPRSQNRVGPSVFDPTRFASPEGDAGRTPTPLCLFTPGNPGVFQVIDAVSRFCHRANRLFGVV